MARRTWLITAIALLAACGDDDDASPAMSTTSMPPTTHQATVPVATTSMTTGPVDTTTTTLPETSVLTTTTTTTSSTTIAVPTSAASCSDAPVFDPARPLREQFVDYLVACGFTDPEAACLFDNLDFDDPGVLAGNVDAMVPAFEECKIDVARMVEIGGA